MGDRPPIIGVDPGGRRTGIAVRGPKDQLVYHALITRDTVPLDWYLGEVTEAIVKARDLARIACNGNIGIGPRIILAVEDLIDPIPQMGLAAVRGLIDTAQVIGAIAGRWVILRVPPGGHGGHPLHTYPDQLVDDREKAGRGRLRHVRAAWDIAYTGRVLHRQQEALK